MAGLWLLIAIHPAAAQQNYELKLNEVPAGLRGELENVSELHKKVRQYPTTAAMRRGAKRDASAFAKALQSAGYYAARPTFVLEKSEDKERPDIVFDLAPGPKFSITRYEIIYEDAFEGRPSSFAEVDLENDGDAAGAALRDAQGRFQRRLWETGYPKAEIVSRRASANFETGDATAIFIFQIRTESALRRTPY